MVQVAISVSLDKMAGKEPQACLLSDSLKDQQDNLEDRLVRQSRITLMELRLLSATGVQLQVKWREFLDD